MLAKALRERGEREASIVNFRKAVALDPDNADYYCDLSVALAESGEFHASLETLQKAMAVDPENPEPYKLSGLLCLEKSEMRDLAGRFLYRALAISPDDVEVAAALLSHAIPGGAMDAVKEASKAWPKSVSKSTICKAGASCCQKYGLYSESEQLVEQARTIDPGDPFLLVLLARAAVARKKHPEAIALYQQALRMQGSVPYAYEYMTQLLRDGDLKRARDIYRSFMQRRPATAGIPEWDGRPSKGKTILMQYEFHYGDTFQFTRFASWLKEAGARVIVECRAKIASLIATIPGVDDVIQKYDDCPRCDAFCLAATLPLLMDSTWEEIGSLVPYIRSSPSMQQKARCRMTVGNRLRVGIVWRGRAGWSKNPYMCRSVPVNELQRLALVPQVQFYSLQAEAESSEVAHVCEMLSAGDWGDDFEHLAGTMEFLDVIVTIDTSIAHLSGALGKKTFVMLPYLADWRWMTDREDSPWYRNMRLFRQVRPGAWEDVVSDVGSALAKLAGNRTDGDVRL